MKKYRLWLACLITLVLSACATKQSTRAWLTKENQVNLPQAKLSQTYHDQQLLTFNYKDQTNSLITLVDADSDSLTVVGLSTLGIRLFKIEYRNNIIHAEQNLFIETLPSASQILSDIMLSIYPIQEWQAVLPAGWQLVDDGLYRNLLNEKQEIIITISYQEPATSQIRKPINIKHNVFGYQIAIQSME